MAKIALTLSNFLCVSLWHSTSYWCQSEERGEEINRSATLIRTLSSSKRMQRCFKHIQTPSACQKQLTLKQLHNYTELMYCQPGGSECDNSCPLKPVGPTSQTHSQCDLWPFHAICPRPRHRLC